MLPSLSSHYCASVSCNLRNETKFDVVSDFCFVTGVNDHEREFTVCQFAGSGIFKDYS